VLLAPHHRCVPSQVQENGDTLRSLRTLPCASPSDTLGHAGADCAAYHNQAIRAQPALPHNHTTFHVFAPSPAASGECLCFFLFFSNVTESLPHSSAKLN